jgi:hypothetical protein
MNDEQLEQEIQEKGLSAPRVTPADIEENIRGEYYFLARQGVNGNGEGIEVTEEDHVALSLLTFCILVLKNGFTVSGESACVSIDNFDAEIGKKVAKANAISKVWPLMGYALKEKQL